MEDYKIRLLDEVTYLDEKMASLEKFVYTPEFKALKWKTRCHLRIQLFYMKRYYFWLAHRMSYSINTDDMEEYALTKMPMTPETKKNKTKNKKNVKKKKTNE